MEALMALDAHIRELSSRHRDLEFKIQAETKHPSVDSLELAALKRQKLKIKEQIELLRSYPRQ
jgi:hypothetical protein